LFKIYTSVHYTPQPVWAPSNSGKPAGDPRQWGHLQGCSVSDSRL